MDESDEIGRKYNELIPEILNKIIEDGKTKLLIFFGRTVVVSELIIKKLKEFQEKGRLLMTVKEGTELFYHPARVQIEIKKVDNNDFYEQTFQIVGVSPKKIKANITNRL